MYSVLQDSRREKTVRAFKRSRLTRVLWITQVEADGASDWTPFTMCPLGLPMARCTFRRRHSRCRSPPVVHTYQSCFYFFIAHAVTHLHDSFLPCHYRKVLCSTGVFASAIVQRQRD